MAATIRDIAQEYVVPSGVTSIRVEVESGGPGRQSSNSVTLQVRPGDAVRLRVICLPEHDF
jgi:hypothetical protein